ncbi:jg12669, partial [Pararge aegeria aegeria]
LIYSRENIIAILESGLLFREDSVEVEQDAPDVATAWKQAGGTSGGWFTSGERNVALLATVALLLASPPRNLHRWSLLKLATYALVPVATRATHRSRCRGALRTLLTLMRDYMALARRATACCREYAALHARLESVTSAVESTHTMLCRQQTELLILMSRASSALLGNVPWLRGDVTYECHNDNLMKIHHAFLVVQSTLLKHIAMAHHMPSANTLKHIYKNHNERIYWIHNVLIHHLIQEFKENYESLERMYRLLKNYGAKDSASAMKKPGSAINDTWLYSDVHTGIARSCLELKLAIDKCSNLDMFLDSCALNKQELDLDVLDRDIDEIIENITKCLSTVQSSQIRLKKMLNKVRVEEDNVQEAEEDEEVSIVKIEDRDPEIKDEVFYCVKTDDEVVTSPVGDILTGPGKKEKENSKVVLTELKRKLVKREDLMRERERQALAKTMPELQNVPEFPRQIPEEFSERKGFISKLVRKRKPVKLFKQYKISRHFRMRKKYEKFNVKILKYEDDGALPSNVVEANGKCDIKSVYLSITKVHYGYDITIWRKCAFGELNFRPDDRKDFLSSGRSECSSMVEDSTESRNVSNNVIVRQKKISHMNDFKFSKKDLELSPSSSETDLELMHNEKVALLDDIRRHRVARKKNVPAKRASVDNVDESLKPIEYSFGTGMAMASVLQVNSKPKTPYMLQEEVFIGDGEVSNDSGNDEDA